MGTLEGRARHAGETLSSLTPPPATSPHPGMGWEWGYIDTVPDSPFAVNLN